MDGRVKALDKRLALEPDNRSLWMEMAGLLAGMERFPEAVAAYSQAILLEPFRAEAYLLRGRKYNSLEQYEEAAADFTLATRIDPEEPDHWYYYGVALYMLRDYRRAGAVFERCLEATRKHKPGELPPVLDWCWMTCNITGDREGARRILSLVDEDTPCDPGLYYVQVYKRRLLLYKGLIPPEEFLDREALEHSDRPVANFITAAYGLANYLVTLGEAEQANGLLREILKAGSYRYAFAYVLARRDLEDWGLLSRLEVHSPMGITP